MADYTYYIYTPDALDHIAGPNPWSLATGYNHTTDRLQLDITDTSDGFFTGDVFNDEVGSDAGQTASVYDTGGTLLTSGQVYAEEYFTLDKPGGGTITLQSVEIGGVLIGYITTEPLVEGVSYNQSGTGDVAATGGDTRLTYAEAGTVPCYAPETLIDTPDGPRAVENLQLGDLVMTLDHGPQPIRWTRSDQQPLEAAEVDAKPVLIAADALGPGRPEQDLIVSPQHRIFVGGHRQLQGLFKAEAFAPAKSLTQLPGIRHMKGKQHITWIHFACDQHEVVTANGCLSESLLLGPMVVNGLTASERQAVTDIFGPAPTPDAALNGPPARECLTVGAVKRQLQEVLKEKGNLVAKEIRKWVVDLAMEKYETERLREATSIDQSRKEAFRAA